MYLTWFDDVAFKCSTPHKTYKVLTTDVVFVENLFKPSKILLKTPLLWWPILHEIWLFIEDHVESLEPNSSKNIFNCFIGLNDDSLFNNLNKATDLNAVNNLIDNYKKHLKYIKVNEIIGILTDYQKNIVEQDPLSKQYNIGQTSTVLMVIDIEEGAGKFQKVSSNLIWYLDMYQITTFSNQDITLDFK